MAGGWGGGFQGSLNLTRETLGTLFIILARCWCLKRGSKGVWGVGVDLTAPARSGKLSASHLVMELTRCHHANQPLLTSWHQKQPAGLAGGCLLPRGHLSLVSWSDEDREIEGTMHLLFYLSFFTSFSRERLLENT